MTGEMSEQEILEFSEAVVREAKAEARESWYGLSKTLRDALCAAEVLRLADLQNRWSGDQMVKAHALACELWRQEAP